MKNLALGLAALAALAVLAGPARAGCANELRAIEAKAREVGDARKRAIMENALDRARQALSERREVACMTAVDQARAQLRL
ncbi:MAG: hypothetical protein ACT4P2_02135 [Pseudomonadota bacterium]